MRNGNGRVFALALAVGYTGTWTLDGSRAARESLPPAEYLSSSYYEIWLAALEAQVVAHGLATQEEIAAGASAGPASPVKTGAACRGDPASLLRGISQ